MITSHPSCPLKMPLVRRRRGLAKFSSSPVTTTTVECQGTAYLCFPEDHSWFQGNISTDDESNYSLYGERVVVSAEEKAAAAAAVAERIRKLSLTESDEENNNAGDDPNGNATSGAAPNEDPAIEDYYRVTMFDHFTGEKHLLPRIFAKRQDTSAAPGQMFLSENGEVTFEVDHVYKGQKADIMIHQFLGSPAHRGNKCLLYTGQINVLFNETIDAGKSWSL